MIANYFTLMRTNNIFKIRSICELRQRKILTLEICITKKLNTEWFVLLRNFLSIGGLSVGFFFVLFLTSSKLQDPV